MNAARAVLGTVALVGAVLGILLDLTSLVLALRRNKSGRGPSGVAGAAWALYFAYAVSRHNLPLLAALTVFHAACHWLIPALHRRWLGGGAGPE